MNNLDSKTGTENLTDIYYEALPTSSLRDFFLIGTPQIFLLFLSC